MLGLDGSCAREMTSFRELCRGTRCRLPRTWAYRQRDTPEHSFGLKSRPDLAVSRRLQFGAKIGGYVDDLSSGRGWDLRRRGPARGSSGCGGDNVVLPPGLFEGLWVRGVGALVLSAWRGQMRRGGRRVGFWRRGMGTRGSGMGQCRRVRHRVSVEICVEGSK